MLTDSGAHFQTLVQNYFTVILSSPPEIDCYGVLCNWIVRLCVCRDVLDVIRMTSVGSHRFLSPNLLHVTALPYRMFCNITLETSLSCFQDDVDALHCCNLQTYLELVYVNRNELALETLRLFNYVHLQFSLIISEINRFFSEIRLYM